MNKLSTACGSRASVAAGRAGRPAREATVSAGWLRKALRYALYAGFIVLVPGSVAILAVWRWLEYRRNAVESAQ